MVSHLWCAVARLQPNWLPGRRLQKRNGLIEQLYYSAKCEPICIYWAAPQPVTDSFTPSVLAAGAEIEFARASSLTDLALNVICALTN